MLTIPKRLRAYGLYRRRLLGEIARVAAHTVTAAIRALAGERDLAVGLVACLPTHGSRANGPPHRHLLVTDGGFRPDGTFVTRPAHDTARLTEAFRRAVLRLFVHLDLFDEDQAAGMLTWPRSGFRVHTAVWEDPLGSRRTIAPSHPDRPVLRAESRRAQGAARDHPRATSRADRGHPPVGEGHTAALLQQIFEVDPLACPTGHGAMRIVACITQASVTDQILTHLRIRAEHATHAGARSPHRRGPPTPRAHGGRSALARSTITSRGAREVDDRAVDSTRSRPTPIEIPIPPVCFNLSPSVPP